MIAAIYARKSNEQNDVTTEQKSVTRQVDGARAFISSKGWTLDETHIYSDDGVSGALFANRAEFQRMMVDAEAGAFEAIVFFDLDNVGRLTMDRDRLRGEIENLVRSIAVGVPADTVAPGIRERELEIAPH